ncbi:spore germination protein [Paenibacillus sp. ISL-20]|uniref:spore germination protein n=1 Tax=Paenibacillus sp. ISL-20 TaxID=2819163 RepID=UPI001BE5C745|nr:spore germination protein [Paenibacillus sp. ISL-20]MBT2760311.1 spore germination protein [Paenibacillus sp. ISL-20]
MNLMEKVLTTDLEESEGILRDLLHNSSDVVFRKLKTDGQILLFIYVEGLVDTNLVEQIILKPFLYQGLQGNNKEDSPFTQTLGQLLPVLKISTATTAGEVVDGVLKGNVALLAEGDSEAMISDFQHYQQRSVDEPATESVVRGPRDGFTESLRVNTSLIRRRLCTHHLVNKSYQLGEFTGTNVEILYLHGIAKDSIVQEVIRRISEIRIDGILESGYIEEMIEDTPYSPFPQIQNTERPDVVCAALLEGKVAIVTANTPFVLIVPMTFWSGLQASEDYYERSIFTTLIRWVRYFMFLIALVLPSIYVALTTFHPQIIPTVLLISIAAAREGVPFPTLVEALLMEFMFEALREAGVRLPKTIGSAVSIVGALVIGQAAVEAGIISAPMVIIVATTGIASFGIPRYNLGTALRILRFPMLLLAGFIGIYGILIGVSIILIHLSCLQSFGLPYLSPVSPETSAYAKDLIFRAPRWSMQRRPKNTTGGNGKRIS